MKNLQLEMPRLSAKAEQCRSTCYDKQKDKMSTATVTTTFHNHLSRTQQRYGAYCGSKGKKYNVRLRASWQTWLYSMTWHMMAYVYP